MRLLGDALFYKDQEGRLKSGSGTIFVSSEYPGLVTLPGTHAMQRQAWVNEVNRVRTD